MSGPIRRRDANRQKPEPFFTLRCDMLSAAACRFTNVAFRCFIVANACWVPTKPDASAGLVVLPHQMIRHPHPSGKPKPEAPSQRNIAPAIDEVLRSGWMECRSKGIAPKRSGSARVAGKAATFDLPCRHKGRGFLVEMPVIFRRPQGSIRLNSTRARADAAELKPLHLRLLYFLASLHDRDRLGALANANCFSVSANEIAEAFCVSRSAINEAVRALVVARRLLLQERRSGRRPATYAFASPYTSFERIGPAIPRASPS